MEQTEKIGHIIDPSLQAMGYELVRVSLSGMRSPTLQVMVERADHAAMTVEDCAAVSRAVSAVLDVEDPIRGSYTLEVSSPGIDRPLTRLADFARFAGHLARVELSLATQGRRRFKGTLLGTEGDTVRLRVEADAKNGEPAEIIALPFSDIQKAKLVLTDALIADHTRREHEDGLG